MIRNATEWTASLAVLALNLIAMPSGFANAIPFVTSKEQHSDNRPMIVTGCVVVVAIIVSILTIIAIVRSRGKDE